MEQPAEKQQKRRVLKTRSNPLMIRFASFVATKNITPNQISLLSIPFAILGMIGLWTWNLTEHRFLQITLLIIAIIGIQGRLICNLIDGMVAVEGGKVTKDGELYNDAPDRLTDILFFVGLGLGVSKPFGLELGLTAGLLAVLTAYVRMLGLSMGTPAFFAGPLAKQHRMALLTAAIVATIIGLFYHLTDEILYIALIVINIGALLTIINRLHLIRQYVLNRDDKDDDKDVESGERIVEAEEAEEVEEKPSLEKDADHA